MISAESARTLVKGYAAKAMAMDNAAAVSFLIFPFFYDLLSINQFVIPPPSFF